MSVPLRISHYDLITPIGRDGPTEIYRARDLRLEREVAVKLLRPEEMARPGALDRFRRETRIASLVTHPHICAVHESGEENGQAFLVCELLEGRALDDLIAESALSAERLLDIGIQLTDALVAAHRRGIVHGNVKPSNVFITTDGHVKLLELGAAAAATEPAKGAVDASSDTISLRVNVPSPPTTGEFFHRYLSPEQVAGAPASERSDVFAVGALLYEMAARVPAFRGDTHAQIAAAITGETPAPPRNLNPKLPRGIEAIIARALQKDPAARQDSAAALLDELRQARRALEQRVRVTPNLGGSRKWIAAAVVLGVILVIGAVAAGSRFRRSAVDPTPAARHSVLVSNIANGTADPDFDDTLRQAVTVYLAQSPYLSLASDERVRSTLVLMGRKPDAPMTHEVASEVCERLGLQALLEGSVSAIGRSTVIALAATDCGGGTTIARRQVEVERKEDVLRALGDITADMRTALGESVASLASHNVAIEDATTPSLDALKAYTEAAKRRAEGAENEAIPLLERAIAIDPQFALAYTTLSSVYGGFGETGRGEEYARLAYEHRNRVSEVERLFITYQYYDRVTGDQLKTREALDVWKRTYPRDYRAPNALAVLLNRLGDYSAAASEAEEAMRRNPAHAFPPSNLAHAHRGAGRYAEARAVAEQAVGRDLQTVPMRRLLYQLAEIQGDAAAASRHLEWGAERRRRFDFTGARAQVAAYRGRMKEARSLYAETLAGAQKEGLPQIASGYASQAALTEALYGARREAVTQARQVVRSATAYEPELRAAMALALAGAADEADGVVGKLRAVRPDDTLLHSAYLPSAEAAVLLARGRADRAVEQLRRASPYEFGFVAALAPAYLRGEARLKAGDFADAAREFRAVLEHRGADPFSPFIPMARLGLARALARDGQTEQSRKTYDALLIEWKDADQDLPVLIEVRKERTALSAQARLMDRRKHAAAVSGNRGEEEDNQEHADSRT